MSELNDAQREEISAAEALRLAESGALVVDVREPDEWARGRSPLAVSLPMSELNERVGELPDDQEILFVCHGGTRSGRVAEVLRRAGYDATNVAGGMVAWAAAGGELTADGDQQPSVD